VRRNTLHFPSFSSFLQRATVALPLAALALPGQAEAAPSYPPLAPVTTWPSVGAVYRVEAVGDSAFIAVSLPEPGQTLRLFDIALFRVDANGALTQTPVPKGAIDYITSAGGAGSAGWATISGFDEVAQRQYVRRLDASGTLTPLFDAQYISGFPSWTYTHVGAFHGTPHDGRMFFRRPEGLVSYGAAGPAAPAISVDGGTAWTNMQVCAGKLFIVDPGKQVFLVEGATSTPLVAAGATLGGLSNEPDCTGKRLLVRSGAGASAFTPAGARAEISLPGYGATTGGSAELAGGFVYARNDTEVDTLVWSNGAAGATNQVTVLAPLPNAYKRVWIGAKALFVGDDLVITDGTVAGTTKLASPKGELRSLVQQDGRTFLFYYDQGVAPAAPTFTVWVTDGTASGTAKLATIPDAYSLGLGGGSGSYSRLVVTSNAVVITAAKKEAGDTTSVRVLRMPFATAPGGAPDAGAGGGGGIAPGGPSTPTEPGADPGSPSGVTPTGATDSGSSASDGCASAGHASGGASAASGLALAMAAAIAAARRRRRR